MPYLVDIFKKYKNNVLVETGSYLGNGVQIALDAGYGKVHSIEIHKHFYYKCLDRFANNDKVSIRLGDTRTKLFKVIKSIDEPITFWLDAHDSECQPIIEELDQISKHHVKNHNILIDDVRDLKENYSLEKVKDKILAINPNYKFELIDSENEDCFFKDGILAATVGEIKNG